MPALRLPLSVTRRPFLPLPSLGLLTLLLTAPLRPAQAAGTLLLLDDPPAESQWAGGLSWRGWPRAPGSSHQRQGLMPALDYSAPNGFFLSTDTGVGWNLAPALLGESGHGWQLGARVWPQAGRPRRDAPPGIDSLNSRLGAELFANAQVHPALLLQSGLSLGGGRYRHGSLLELGATSGIPLGQDLLAISLAASYGNSAQLRGSFGVSPAEAARSGLPEFHPASGWQDWSVSLSGEHKFSSDWSVSGQWTHARLIAQAARSPLTQSRQQPSFILSVWHQF